MNTKSQTGYRRVIRSMRLLAEHRAQVERVASELGRRGLVDLADDLRLSLKTLAALPGQSGNQVQ